MNPNYRLFATLQFYAKQIFINNTRGTPMSDFLSHSFPDYKKPKIKNMIWQKDKKIVIRFYFCLFAGSLMQNVHSNELTGKDVKICTILNSKIMNSVVKTKKMYINCSIGSDLRNRYGTSPSMHSPCSRRNHRCDKTCRNSPHR